MDGIWIILVCGQEQLTGYMCLNRVQTADSLCVVQAFSPCLFQQDDLTGPNLFLKFWQEKVTAQQHYEKWKKDLDQKKTNRITWPQDMRLFCRGCSDAAGIPKRVCLKNFPRKSKTDLFATVAEGMERFCNGCRRTFNIVQSYKEQNQEFLAGIVQQHVLDHVWQEQ